MTEHDTQNAIIDLIRYRGGVATRVNSGTAIFKRDGVTNVIKGAEKGTADIIACFKGFYLAIEVKHGKNKPTPEQVDFGRMVNRAGGIFLVAYDTKIIEKELDRLERGEG